MRIGKSKITINRNFKSVLTQSTVIVRLYVMRLRSFLYSHFFLFLSFLFLFFFFLIFFLPFFCLFLLFVFRFSSSRLPSLALLYSVLAPRRVFAADAFSPSTPTPRMILDLFTSRLILPDAFPIVPYVAL